MGFGVQPNAGWQGSSLHFRVGNDGVCFQIVAYFLWHTIWGVDQLQELKIYINQEWLQSQAKARNKVEEGLWFLAVLSFGGG